VFVWANEPRLATKQADKKVTVFFMVM